MIAQGVAEGDSGFRVSVLIADSSPEVVRRQGMHATVEAMAIFRSSAVAQDMIGAARIPTPHSTTEANRVKIRPVTYSCFLSKV
jgi:hypothetical protein